MTSTFAELKSRVSRRLNAGSFWTDSEIGTVVNDIYWEMCEESECYETDLTLTTTTTDTYYDLEDQDPIILTPHRVWNPATSKWLAIDYVRNLDKVCGRWGEAGAEPTAWFMRGTSMFGVFPRTTAAGTLLITGSAMPDVMVAETDTPVFPIQFHSGIVDGAVSVLKALERETKTAAKLYEVYAAKRADLSWWVKQRASRAHLPVVGSRYGEAR